MKTNNNQQMLIRKFSHELRNPLTIMYSTVQLIQSQHPEVKDYHHWSELTQNIGFMKSILDDMASFDSVGQLNLTTFSFRTFIEQISLSFAASIADTNLEYTSKIDPSVNQITGDKTKLQEVFLNLLKNASEATLPEGSIYLHAYTEGDSLIVTVKDTGCGIPKDKQAAIFRPLVTYKCGGSGLGLTITKDIIITHGGKIEVTSEVGQGSTFKVTIPID